MSKTEKFDENQSKGSVCWAVCERCRRETRHEVMVSLEVSDSHPDYDFHVSSSFQIVRCMGCLWVSFRQEWSSSDDEEPGGEPLEPRVVLYPARSSVFKPLDGEELLPSKVQRIYRETYFALTNQQPILAGIGLRALLEAVCAHENATGRTLSDQITSLGQGGKLTTDQANVLHGIRFLGNEAAHEVEPPRAQATEAAMRVVEHLLNTVYVVPQVANQLPVSAKPRKKGS